MAKHTDSNVKPFRRWSASRWSWTRRRSKRRATAWTKAP